MRSHSTNGRIYGTSNAVNSRDESLFPDVSTTNYHEKLLLNPNDWQRDQRCVVNTRRYPWRELRATTVGQRRLPIEPIPAEAPCNGDEGSRAPHVQVQFQRRFISFNSKSRSQAFRMLRVSKASRFTRGKPDSARPTSRPSCPTMLAARRGRAVA